LVVGADAPVFRPVVAPESSDLQQLVEQIAGRIGRALERRGLVERDLENAWLATDTEACPLDDLLGHSIGIGPGALHEAGWAVCGRRAARGFGGLSTAGWFEIPIRSPIEVAKGQ
jgi:hypothetical protein